MFGLLILYVEPYSIKRLRYKHSLVLLIACMFSLPNAKSRIEQLFGAVLSLSCDPVKHSRFLGFHKHQCIKYLEERSCKITKSA